MNYFVLMTKGPEAGVIEVYPPKSPEAWKFQEGQSLIKQFPKGAAIQFSSNFPDARKLYDFQDNVLSALIISEKVRKVLESLKITNAEYLPVDVKDHKGKVVGKDYAILNLLGTEDAIDMEKGVYRMSNLEEDQIGRIKKFAINEKGIRPGIKIFRCTRKRRLVLINEEVHAAFVKAGLTGFKAVKAESWNGLEL
jgi:hypothetical protein